MKVESNEVVASELRAVVLHLARELRVLAAKHGLSPTQTSVISLLDREGGLRASEIALREGLNPTLVSRVLNVLERGGYLRRERDNADGRAVVIVATASGHALAVKLRRERTRWLQSRLQHLNETEVANLLAALPALQTLAHALPPSLQARP